MSDNLQRKTAFPLFLDSFEGATAERYYQCTTAFWIFDVPGCCASPSCSIVLVILVLVLSYLSIGRNMQDILLGIAQRCDLPVFFRWIYYCHSSKSTGKKIGKTHLCALHCQHGQSCLYERL